ncbi:class I adenylate-forming enzyme family protein [Actinoallomurus soli]|uniref:class I adenylate-forming enzyme family protein n=1 Tax=Actinoallomurus soli TaxID=2952535 RepID=UPI002093C6B4|nr:AMP-binding protein [Actinoallomurus soli]MCO5973473.1 AMP-binding protein [Actinoallomurus soli]
MQDRPDDAIFPQALLDALASAPEAPAFEHGERVVSRGALLETIRRVAGGLRAAGLGPGRGLAMVASVSPEAFAARVAAYALGCRVVGVRPGHTAAQLAAMLNADVEAVVVDGPSLTPQLVAATGDRPLLSLGECPEGKDLLTGAADEPLTARGRPDDVARLTYTSGSTGLPKGCAQTYRALTDHWAHRPSTWPSEVARMAHGFERCLVFGTLASPVVMDWTTLSLMGGGVGVIPDPADTRPLFPYALERYRITGTIMTVPRLYQLLDVLREEPADLGSLRAVMVSGSPVNPRRLAEATERLGPVVYQGYGQSEAGLISVLTPEMIAEGPADVLASVGRPLPFVDISVRAEDGRPVRAGETGEIWLRSPYMMSGYWGDPAQTAETLRDGLLRTRDLGRFDDRGLLHLVGRSRDVIIVNAEVCYAGPIESVLAEHPEVDQAYVVGTPDERTGEAIHAFVVPAGGRAPEPSALARMVRERLGAGSVPKTITVIPEAPVAASGKFDKRALLARLSDHGER